VAHRFQPTPDLRTSIKKQSLNHTLPRRIKSDSRLSRIATLTSRFASKKLVSSAYCCDISIANRRVQPFKDLLAIHGIPSRLIPSSRNAAAGENSASGLSGWRFGYCRRTALDAFRQALRDHGYIEGQNILIETRHEGRDLDRLPEHAAEFGRAKAPSFCGGYD
jgi:hypothetical protein